MVFDLDSITVIAWAPLGAPGTGITNAQYTSLDADRTALLARPNITTLSAVPDVQLTSLVDGQTIGWHAATSKWLNVANTEALAAVKVNGATVLANAQQVNFSNAFSGAVDGTITTQANIAPVFGTTSGTIADGAHLHNPVLPNRWTFAATGLLSSGSRTLASNTSSVLVTGVTYSWNAMLVVTGRNNVNNGSVTITLTVNGSAISRTLTTVGGVPHEMTIPWAGTGLVGAGAGVTVAASIAYNAGDATNVDDGWVTFVAFPNH